MKVKPDLISQPALCACRPQDSLEVPELHVKAVRLISGQACEWLTVRQQDQAALLRKA